jgi:hypothetical protein
VKLPVCARITSKPSCWFEDLVEARVSVVGGGGAGFALELDDLRAFGVAALEFGDEPLRGHAAFLDEVGGDQRGVELLLAFADAAVEEDDGDAGFFGEAESILPTRLDDGREEDGVDLLSHEALDGADLVLLLTLAADELELDAAAFGFFAHGVGLRRAPVGLGAGLREADDELRVAGRAGPGRVGLGGWAAAEEQGAAQSDEQREESDQEGGGTHGGNLASACARSTKFERSSLQCAHRLLRTCALRIVCWIWRVFGPNISACANS